MARLWLFAQFLLLCFAALFPASECSVIQVIPQSQRVAGVFMIPEGGQYTLNFTAARAACLYLNVTIATKDQMEHAVLRGLETCRYGWIAEKIAVIPRLISEEKCGKGNTGLVLWYARAESKFGAYCFSASDLEETTKTFKPASQTSTSPTTPTALTQTSTPTTTPVKSTTEAAPSRKPITIKSPEQQTSLTSASTLLVQTTRSPGISSTSTSLRPFSTSKPAVITSAFSTSLHSSSFSVSSFSVLPQSPSPEKLPLGAVPTALIILVVILLLLTAAGAVWYYKLNSFTFCSPGQQNDDTETEMWKHTDSEMDLHSQHGAEEDDEYDESDRKYSSDITLCVNPNIKTHSLE
ncbi:lymphatic vessel endothelial hyaluronic acid receptor 1 [Lates calcarifer]|uniref:Lymphatic vessel endothelial hyaluronic acid receptor 1 n=2 Tax=Lates calcarifer TaxID=8187 RepID=A0AAJ7V8N3_LATCA|nr:lymphatic vessel endothelial hyaluronic acid receptor 1 [Lates calcarifer]